MTIFWYKPNSTKITLAVWSRWTTAVEQDAFSQGIMRTSGTRSPFYVLKVCRHAPVHTWRSADNPWSWHSPSTFTRTPGVTLGLPGGQARMTSAFTQGPPSRPKFHLLVTNTSLWGLHSPRHTSNFIKLWKKRIHFLKNLLYEVID